MVRRIGALPQTVLVTQLKHAIDQARISDPLRGANGAARRTLRRLIRRNPQSVQSFHVLYNLGRARREWLVWLIDQEIGLDAATAERWSFQPSTD